MTGAFSRELWRAAFVIGRRDVRATVLSRTFLLFLCAPLFPVLFGGLFSLVASHNATASRPPALVAIASPAAASALSAAHDRLERDLPGAIPALRVLPAAGDPLAKADRLLSQRNDPPDAVLIAGDRPLLVGPADAIGHLRDPVRLLIGEAARDAVLARAGKRIPDPPLAVRPMAVPPSPADHRGFAQGAQTALFALTILLASMLLSNMVEEKSNKVVEVLAAAVPVQAIFLGKLFGMLTISLIGLAVWGTAAAAAGGLLSGGLVAPAVGWPVFALLGFAYFATNYLLLGALFLGIGSHARSVREVQTLSMPVTMAQLVLFALASTAIGNPAGTLARIAAVLPWSSPLAMLADAAQSPALWVHPLALAWQVAWVAISISVSAALFRRNELNSAAPRRNRARQSGAPAS